MSIIDQDEEKGKKDELVITTDKKENESVQFAKAIEIAQEKIGEHLKKEEKRNNVGNSRNKVKSKEAIKYQFDTQIREAIDGVKDKLIAAVKQGTTSADAVKFVTLCLSWMVGSLDKEKRKILADVIVDKFHIAQGIAIHFVFWFCFFASLHSLCLFFGGYCDIIDGIIYWIILAYYICGICEIWK